MAFDAIQFCRDFGVPYSTEGDRHCRPDWVQFHCPYCIGGNSKWWMGFNTVSDYFNCWRCGWKPRIDTISKLAGIPKDKAVRVYLQYKGTPLAREHKVKGGAAYVQLPTMLENPSPRHELYLRARRFDPQKLMEMYGIGFTGATPLDWKFRIVIPITVGGQIVSYQTRTICDNVQPRYKACPIPKEVIHHKNTLYGYDQCEGYSQGIVVEGIFDAWRIGDGCVATFGVEFSHAQAMMIARRFDHVGILYDSDAIDRADKLAATLTALRPIKVDVLELEHGDPADMSQPEVDQLRKEFFTDSIDNRF